MVIIRATVAKVMQNNLERMPAAWVIGGERGGGGGDKREERAGMTGGDSSLFTPPPLSEMEDVWLLLSLCARIVF